MNDKELERIEKELLSNIDHENDLEYQIEATSKNVAAYLSINNECRAEFLNEPYSFKCCKTYKNGKQGFYVVIANLKHYKENKNRYIPFTVTVELDNNFTYRENLKAAIEAFFRHITGLVQPEEIN